MKGHYYLYDWENANIIQFLYVTLFHVYPEKKLRGKQNHFSGLWRNLEVWSGYDMGWRAVVGIRGRKSCELQLEEIQFCPQSNGEILKCFN